MRIRNKNGKGTKDIGFVIGTNPATLILRC